ncbi:tetratricopeptide repeat protein [Lipingzhangella sp. LS1_29]|uniref:Tetratricopeptide repeat protein n=1 Tax=Lipingzhangella rawalii TaxID=2055835 RepID=A0ABU2H661_9ACTN|nr:tetratricopeptide repeat protein [Lipingzhangella rawalii]MDS1270497.1 tetratricopeptide repeat protein [Lipingzhangella rawalii]
MQPADFSTSGAVDLGARKASLDREAKRKAEADSGNANPYAIDVNEQNFQNEVLQRSTQVPVVLAILATWSEQAKQVETALDSLARAAGGQWLLAKVDSDASPQLVQALGAPGAPMVAMVIQGQVVPGPSGEATKDQLRQWLVQVFEGLRQQGVIPEGYTGVGPEEADEPQASPSSQDPNHAAAEQALQAGDYDGAEQAYRAALEADSNDEDARVGLARVRLLARVRDLDLTEVREAAARNPDDVAAQCRVADVDMAGGKVQDAFDRLIGTVRRTRDEDRDAARRHLLDLFEVLGSGDPRVNQARRALTSALF